MVAKDVNLKIIDSRKCFWLLSCWEYEAVFRTRNRIHRKSGGQPDNDLIHTHSNKPKRKVYAEGRNGSDPVSSSTSFKGLKQFNIVSETQLSFLVSFKDLYHLKKN